MHKITPTFCLLALLEIGAITNAAAYPQFLNIAQQKEQLINSASQNNWYKWKIGTYKNLPPHPFIAGDDNKGNPVYICQAPYGSNSLKNVGYGIHPGQLTNDGCRISYAGKSYLKKTNYKILTIKGIAKWTSPWAEALNTQEQLNKNKKLPVTTTVTISNKQSTISINPQPVIGGIDLNNNYLYICRCTYKGNLKIGKLVTGACDISWQGKEIRVPLYEIKPRTASRFKINVTLLFLHPKSKIIPQQTSPVKFQWASYSNKKFGFSIKHPTILKPTKIFHRSYLVSDAWSRYDEYSKTANTHSIISFPIIDTNIDGDGGPYYYADVRIGASSNPQDMKNCYTILYPKKMISPISKINKLNFHKLELSDAAMSQYVSGDSYRIKHNGLCYAVEFVETGSQPEPSQINLLKQTRNQARKIAMKIISSFTFTSYT